MKKRKCIDYKRRQRLAQAIVAPDRCRAVLHLGNRRSVLIADDEAELLRLRRTVSDLHFAGRLGHRGETR
jgi:hypothetical protein